MVQQGMDLGDTFTPGRPLQPYFGYSTRPRSTDYPVSVNTATQGRAAWGRASYDTLKAIIDAYDIARDCIDHKIDEIRSMEPMFQPAHGVEEDVDEAIDVARLVLEYPDRELPYDAWLSKWLENALKYDSAPLYKRRNFNGDVIGLEVVDGKTIHPYIDENGRRPEPGAPAYYQTVHGMVGTWFTSDDIIWVPFRPQEDSPYGLAPIESALLTANTDIREQWHFLQMFTDGSVPAGFMELPPDVSDPDQVAEWQDYWDSVVMGDQAKLHQLIAVAYGSKFTQTKPASFDVAFAEHLMMRTCARFGVVPQDIGLIKDVNRATGETQMDIQFRVNTLPWVRYVEGILSRYLRRDIGLPVKVKLNTGRDQEDRLTEAQAHKLYVDMGAESPDEVRVDVLGKKVSKTRPIGRFYATPRLGPVTMLAIEGVTGKTDPETYGPADDQPILDQPYVPPIGVVPTPGTTDDQASLAAVDAYQVQARRQLEAADPRRETEAQREARGAKQNPQTGQAPLKAAPQGSQDQQKDAQNAAKPAGSAPKKPKPPKGTKAPKGTAGAQDATDTEAGVRKADLTGDEAAELLAFREYVTGSKRRGKWARDFVFKSVSAPVAAELNRGARTEVEQLLKAKVVDTAPASGGDVARAVYDQLSEDFPKEDIKWVLGQTWSGPELVPLDEIDSSNKDSWQAIHDKPQVYKLARKMLHGKGDRPLVLIERPGKDTLMIADGHHHYLAAESIRRPVRAYIAHVGKVTGPWDEMHSYQQKPKSEGIAKARTPGWAGSVGPTPAEYSQPHVYARDTGSGAGNCVCGSGPRDPVHVQLAPGVPNPDAATAVNDDGEPVAKAGTPGLTKRSGMISLDLERGTLPMLPGGVDDHHVTVVYLGKDVDDAAFAESCARAAAAAASMPGPVTGTVGGIDSFPPSTGSGGLVPAFVPVDLPGAHELRAQLGDLSASEHTDYHPHVTLTYLQPGEQLPDPVPNTPVTFTHLSVHRGPDVVRIPLGAPTAVPVVKADPDPKAGARPADTWPGWQYDLEAAAYWGPRIAAAILGAVDVTAIAQAWLGGHRDKQDAAHRAALIATAAAWLATYQARIAAALRPVLAEIATDGYAIGTAAAVSLTTGHPMVLGDWEPGDIEAAERLILRDGDGAGLRALFEAAQHTIGLMADTRTDAMAKALADAVLNRDSTNTLGAALRSVLANPDRAAKLALDQLSRASGAGAQSVYMRASVATHRWITAEDDRVCVICDENAAAGSVPLGMPFPSGDLHPPAHPGGCRCATIPG